MLCLLLPWCFKYAVRLAEMLLDQSASQLRFHMLIWLAKLKQLLVAVVYHRTFDLKPLVGKMSGIPAGSRTVRGVAWCGRRGARSRGQIDWTFVAY